MEDKEEKRLYDIEYRKKNAVRLRAQVKEYRARDPEKWKRYKKNWSLRKKYDISFEDFEKMLAAQGWSCAICETPLDLWGRTTHVDHDHETGVVRGILCVRCNIGIGYIDDPDVMKKARQYICKR